MSGLAIGEFNDLLTAITPISIDGPKTLFNEALNNTQLLGPKMLRGQPYTKVVQSGEKIIGHSMFDDKTSRRSTRAGARHRWSKPTIATRRSYDWRIEIDEMAWSEPEVILQGGNRNLSTRGRFAVFFDVIASLEERLMTSWWKGGEANLWRFPIASEMENNSSTGTEGLHPYSIPAWVNEESTTLYPSFLTANGGQDIIGGVNAVTQTKWRNYKDTYTEQPSENIGGGWDGFDALERALQKTKFMKLPNGTGAFGSQNQMGGKRAYCVSLTGWQYMTRALRTSNDNLFTKQDANYPHPTYAQADILYISSLDDAALYDDGSGGYTDELSATLNGPRIYQLNFETLFPVYHADKYMDFLPVKQDFGTVDVWVRPVNQYSNNVCISRQQQAIISPTAAVIP